VDKFLFVWLAHVLKAYYLVLLLVYSASVQRKNAYFYLDTLYD